MTIRFHCPSCDETLKAPDEMTGKRVKCSVCGAATAVPTLRSGATETTAEKPPAASPARNQRPTRKRSADPFDDLREEEVPARPRRRRSRRETAVMPWWYVAGAGAALLLVLVGVIVVVARSGARETPPKTTEARLEPGTAVPIPIPIVNPSGPGGATGTPLPEKPREKPNRTEVARGNPPTGTNPPVLTEKVEGDRLFISRLDVDPGSVRPTSPPQPGTTNSSANWVTVVPPKPLSTNVTRGVAWLVRAQKANGGWAAEETGRPGAPGALQTRDQPTVTDTCLATLALLRAGNTGAGGDHSRNIVNGINFVCSQVEQSDPASPYVTNLRQTIVQMKMGPHFDTYVAAWLLAEAAGRMPDRAGEQRVKKALATVLDKIQHQQRPDGSWFDVAAYDGSGRPSMAGRPGFPGPTGGPFPPGGPFPSGPPTGGPFPPGRPFPSRPPRGPVRPGTVPGSPPGPAFQRPALAPVLGQAMAVKGLNRARQAGIPVDNTVLDKARTFAQRSFHQDRGEFALQGSFGILLYASASHLGAMQDSLNTQRMLAGGSQREALQRDTQLRDQAFQAVVNKLNDRKFLLHFGQYGGEDFLAYMLLSEAMAIKSDQAWLKWDKSMTEQLNRQQNQDGSWTGHHCTTGRTFCTAAVVLVLAADRAPVPLSSLPKE
jgi:hypothetical protein